MRILVTGAAGFIGCQLSCKLLAQGHEVTGLDNLDPYYDPALKKDRLARLENGKFSFRLQDLQDQAPLENLFAEKKFDYVVNLAAQAGVRYSLVNPMAYVATNITGFANLLECCRKYPVAHLVYASSSSVYGLHENWPFSEHQGVDHPASLYAATKKSNELMAHSYAHLFGIPATGLRFFTVYGPWGRPDMALFLFTKAILEGKPINVFNNGQLQRDFTHIDDIVEGVCRILFQPPAPDPGWDAARPDPASSSAPWCVFNIGNNHTVKLEDFIAEIEEATGKKAIKNYLPMQPGDVKSTLADVSELEKATGFAPSIPLKDGIKEYVRWHRDYYGK